MYNFHRFYGEQQKNETKEKWTTPTIHQMYDILEDLDIEKILDPIIDNRNSEISELSVAQLRHECHTRNLSNRGKKVILDIFAILFKYVV